MNSIKNLCMNEQGKDPYIIAQKLMSLNEIPMHGPIHHFIDGAALMTAMHNAGVKFDLDKGLDELFERSKMMPGATCGNWGVCGAASSIGAALSVIHGTGPLSSNEYYKDNLRLTSAVLGRIAEIGGPRCCKRNGFTAIDEAIEFVNNRYGIELENSGYICERSDRNQQCIGENCPFHKK